MSLKGLVSKIEKELLKLNNKRNYSPIKKWVKDVSKHLSQVNIQIANKHRKTAQHHVPLGNCKFKTTGYHYSPMSMAVIQKMTTANAGVGY